METSAQGGRWFAWLAGGLIVAFILVTLTEARLKSPTHDEPAHIAAGLSYFVTHEIFRANPEHPPLLKELSALSMMAAGIRWPHTKDADYLVHGDDPGRVYFLEWPVGIEIMRLNGPDRILFWARLPMILIAALLAAMLYVWGRELLGPLAAAGAVFVFVTDPRYWHTRNWSPPMSEWQPLPCSRYSRCGSTCSGRAGSGCCCAV